MKKFLTTFATIACMILAASCSNDEPSNDSPLFVKSSDDIASSSSKRTIDEAAKIACDDIDKPDPFKSKFIDVYFLTVSK